jgi:hypothetical protein
MMTTNYHTTRDLKLSPENFLPISIGKSTTEWIIKSVDFDDGKLQYDEPMFAFGKSSVIFDAPRLSIEPYCDVGKAHYFIMGRDTMMVKFDRKSTYNQRFEIVTFALVRKSAVEAEARKRVSLSNDVVYVSQMERLGTIADTVENTLLKTQSELGDIKQDLAKTNKAVRSGFREIMKDTKDTNKAFKQTADSWNFSNVFQSLSHNISEFFTSRGSKVCVKVLTLFVAGGLILKLMVSLAEFSGGALGNALKELRQRRFQTLVNGLAAFLGTLALLKPAYGSLRDLLLLACPPSSAKLDKDVVEESTDGKEQENHEAYTMVGNGWQVTIDQNADPEKVVEGLHDYFNAGPPEDSKTSSSGLDSKTVEDDSQRLENSHTYEGQGNNGGSNDSIIGLASLIAVAGTFARYLADDSIDVHTTFASLRANSTAAVTLCQAVNYIIKQFPDDYRVAVYKVFRFSEPVNLSRAHRDLVLQAYQCASEIDKDVGKTNAFKNKVMHIQEQLYSEIPKIQLTKDTFSLAVLKDALKEIRRIVPRLTSVPNAGNEKIEPVGMWVHGCSGSGKTKMRQGISKELFAQFEPERRSFTGNCADQYASCYAGQLIYCVDDMGTDVKATRDSLLVPQLMTWLSPDPTVMNMAFKKDERFNSLMVYITSNANPLQLVQAFNVTNKEAVLRRFNQGGGWCVYVQPKEDFAELDDDGYIVGNKSKIQQFAERDPESARRYEHLDIFITNGRVGDRKQRVTEDTPGFERITFPQLLDKVATALLCNMQIYRNSLTMPNDAKRQLCAHHANAIFDKYDEIQRFTIEGQVGKETDSKSQSLLQKIAGKLSDRKTEAKTKDAKALTSEHKAKRFTNNANTKACKAFSNNVSDLSNELSQLDSHNHMLSNHIAVKAGITVQNIVWGSSMHGGASASETFEQMSKIIRENKAVQKAERKAKRNLEVFAIGKCEDCFFSPQSMAIAISQVVHAGMNVDFTTGVQFREEALDIYLRCVSDGETVQTARRRVLMHLYNVHRDGKYPVPKIDHVKYFYDLENDVATNGRFYVSKPVADFLRGFYKEEIHNDSWRGKLERYSQHYKGSAVSTLHSVLQSMENWYEECHKNLIKHYKDQYDLKCGLKAFGLVTLALTMLAGFGYATHTALKYFSSRDELEEDYALEVQRYQRRRNNQTREKKQPSIRTHKPQDIYQTHTIVHQSKKSEERRIVPADFPFLRVLSGAQCMFRASYDNKVATGRAWRTGNYFLLNRHYFGDLKEGATVNMTWRNKTYDLQYFEEDVFVVQEGGDMAIWRPKRNTNQSMPAGPLLYKYFPKASDILSTFGGSTSLANRKAFLIDSYEQRELKEDVISHHVTGAASFLVENNRFEIKQGQGYRYDATEAGDCCLFLTDGQLLRGLHIAGARHNDTGRISFGIAQTLVRERFEEFHVTLEKQGYPIIFDNNACIETEHMNPDPSLANMADVPNGATPIGILHERASVPTRSKLVRTRLDMEEFALVNKRPAPLIAAEQPAELKVEGKSFLAGLQEKFARKPPDYDPVTYADTINEIVARVYTDETPYHWSFEECVNPPPTRSINPLPTGTGAGHLWKKPGVKGKRHLLQYDEKQQRFIADPLLRKQFEEKCELLEQGYVPFFIWSSFPKDELIRPGKATREVTAAQIDFSFIFRRYFGSFLDAYRKDALNNQHVIGLEVMGPAWSRVIERLVAVSKEGFDSDVKNFDSTLGPQFFLNCAAAINTWYDNNGYGTLKGHRARLCLFHSIVFNYTVIGVTVSQMHNGQCTGQPGTADINTIGRTGKSAQCYRVKVPELCDSKDLNDGLLPTAGIVGFFTYVYGCGLGDDRIETIHPTVKPYYNYHVFSQFMAKRGVTITPADKSPGVPPATKPAEDLEFLSCKTRYAPGQIDGSPFLPLVKKTSLLKPLMYVRPSVELSEPDALASNIDDTLGRVWFYGKKEFNQWRTRLMKDYRKHYKIPLNPPTFECISARYNGYPTFTYECQGLTISSTKVQNHLANVTDSSVESNPHNSAESKTQVDAKAGNDNPNVGQHLGGVVRTSYPNFGPGEGISFAQPLAITMDLEKTNQSVFAGIDDLAYLRFCRMTHVDQISVTSMDTSRSILGSYALCPNQALIGANLGDRRSVSSLCYLSTLNTYWRGTLRHSFHFVAPGTATCRLAVSILYDVHSAPPTFEEVLGQAYTVIDINTGSNVLVVDIPYVATTELLEVYNGQPPTNATDYSMGTLFLTVLNAYRAPESASPTMYVEHFEGAGDDFELYMPFGVNATTIPTISGVNPPVTYENQVLISTWNESDFTYVTQMDLPDIGGRRIVNAEAGTENAVLMKTKDFSPVTRTSPIVRTPQTIRTLSRRFYLIAVLQEDTVLRNGEWSCLSSGQPAYYVAISGVNTFTAPFRTWTGTTVWRFVCDKRLAITYRPVVNRNQAEGFTRYTTASAPGRGPSLPVAMLHPDVGYVDVIVPFSSRFSACLLQKQFAAGLSENFTCGDLIVNYLDERAPCQVFFSGGDGFNFGVPFTLPQISLRNTRVAPDEYETKLSRRGEAKHSLDRKASPITSDSSSLSDDVVEIDPLRESQFTIIPQMNDPGDVQISPDEKVGATMVENKAVTSEITDAKSVHDHKFVAQPSLNFEDYMMRPQLIATFDWSITDPTGTEIFGRAIPFALNTNTAKRALEAFRYLRTDAVTTLKLNGTPFHAGRLAMCFGPLSGDSSRMVTKQSQTFLPHAFIDAQASASATLTIPYRQIRPLLRTQVSSAGDPLTQIGWFSVFVFTPLTVGVGGNGTLEVSLFVSYPDSSLRVINQI